MRVHHLDYDTIDAYLKDFTQNRFPIARKKYPKSPVVICYIGNSGLELLERLGCINWNLLECSIILRVEYERSNQETSFYTFTPTDNGKDSPISLDHLPKFVEGTHVLVLDSLVYTGATLRSVVEMFESAGAQAVTSYGLAVRSTSMIIPNYFGFMIDHDDRALFMLKEMPNNRIMPHGCLRLLSENDLTRPLVNSNVDSMDRETWCDKYYSMQANQYNKTFIYEQGNRILAYLTLTCKQNRCLFLDAIAVDMISRGDKLGGFLMRWAETFAMHRGCQRIDMWAIDDKVSWYEKYGYSLSSEKALSLPDGKNVEVYRKMTKEITANRMGMSDVLLEFS